MSESPKPSSGPSGTDESATATAINAVHAAKTGAQVGKVAGAHGAAAGAAIGAGRELLKNRRIRSVVGGLLAVVLLGYIAVPTMLASSIAGMISGQSQSRNQLGVTTATADGLTAEDVEAYQLAAGSTGTHWAILAAADYAAGDWGGRGKPAFGIDRDAFNKAVAAIGVDPVAADADTQTVGYAWGRLLASRIMATNPDVDPQQIDAGVGTAPDPSNPDRTIRALAKDDPDAVDAANATKEAFVKVLGEMPTSTKGDAQRIFDTALRWMLGQQEASGSSACGPLTGAAGSTTTATIADAGAAGAAAGGVPKVKGFNEDQVKNVIVMVQVGKKLKLPERAWQIAIMTALVESQALNIKFGDADSQGLFQQRPSVGWGTAAEITDPEKSSLAFYGKADHTKNPGLTDVKGWETMPMGEAAQAVQISAVPGAYAEREKDAELLLAAVAGVAAVEAVGSTADCSAQQLGDFANCPPTGWDDLEKPPGLGKLIPPDALRTLRCGKQKFPQFKQVGTYGARAIAADEHGTGRAIDWMVPGGWQNNPVGHKVTADLANWLVKNRKQLGVEYVIYNNKIWSAARDKPDAVYPQDWRPYKVCTPPRGTVESCGPTGAHLDHVHVTLYGNKGVVESAAALSDGAWTIPFRDNFQMGAGTCTAGTDCWGYGDHTGQDMAAAENSPILSVGSGVVKTAKILCPNLTNAQRTSNASCSYGKFVVIDHGGGVNSYYAHMNAIQPGIKPGVRVKPGQQLGIEGSQGRSYGAHLHLEIRKNGATLNPTAYLEQQGVNLRCDPLMKGIYDDRLPAGKCS